MIKVNSSHPHRPTYNQVNPPDPRDPYRAA